MSNTESAVSLEALFSGPFETVFSAIATLQAQLLDISSRLEIVTKDRDEQKKRADMLHYRIETYTRHFNSCRLVDRNVKIERILREVTTVAQDLKKTQESQNCPSPLQEVAKELAKILAEQ